MPQYPAGSPEAEVAEFCRRIYTTYSEYDPARLEALDHPDCTLWDLFEPELVQGAEARAAFRQADMAVSRGRGPLTIDVEDPLVSCWDDTAVARYYLNYRFEPPYPLEGRVRVTTVLRRIDGAWRRIHHHEGVVPTGRPALEE